MYLVTADMIGQGCNGTESDSQRTAALVKQIRLLGSSPMIAYDSDARDERKCKECLFDPGPVSLQHLFELLHARAPGLFVELRDSGQI